MLIRNPDSIRALCCATFTGWSRSDKGKR